MKNQSRQGISMRGAYRLAPQKLHVTTKARGRAVIQALNPDGSVSQELAANNLILNVGIEALKTRSWAANLEVCVLGTGTEENSVTGGTSTASQSGHTITLDVATGFTFNADLVSDVGKTIKWAGARARIVSVESTTSATAYESQTVDPPAAFTVWNTEQTILDFTETAGRRIGSSGYHTAGSGCGTSILGNVVTHKRTWDFPAETGSVTYNEIGISHSDTPADELFSRVKLPAGLSVVALQSVRVVYTLELTIDPDTAFAKTADITGWPVQTDPPAVPPYTTEGDEQIQLIALAEINASTGATQENVAKGLSLEPYSIGEDCAVFMSNSSAALVAFGSAADRTGTETAVRTDTAIDTNDLYAGYVEKVVIYPTGTVDVPADGNSDGWRSIGVGKANDGADPFVISGFVFLFDDPQTKDSLHTLELRFAYTWSQTLA